MNHTYADPAEIAGRSAGELVYWAALGLAAAADVAAFDQIVSIVMQQLDAWLIWLAVTGFTATALTMAHFAGRLLRDRTAGLPLRWPALAVLVVPWVLLGLTAFVVRLIVADQSNSATAVGGLSESDQLAASAGMFLVLYLGSGVAAGVGAYLTRNPLRSRYRQAARRYRRALRRLARSQPPYERALSVLQLHVRRRLRDEGNHAAARSLRLAQADELKRYAAILIAAYLQNPSATDGMTLPDRVPLRPGRPTHDEPR